MAEPHDLIDRSLKVLVRHAPGAFLQLAGIDADPDTVTVSDTAVNIPELRGDQLLLIGRKNEYLFDTLHLWEHAGAIRSGELAELAALLVLCEDAPTEVTLQEERELIFGLEVPRAVRADLFAVPVMAGSHYFAQNTLLNIFREEWMMLKEASFIEEWIEEGIAERAPELEARGEAMGARRVLLRQLRKRFGELSEAVIARVEAEGPEWCGEVAERLLDAQSLAELGLEASP